MSDTPQGCAVISTTKVIIGASRSAGLDLGQELATFRPKEQYAEVPAARQRHAIAMAGLFIAAKTSWIDLDFVAQKNRHVAHWGQRGSEDSNFPPIATGCVAARRAKVRRASTLAVK